MAKKGQPKEVLKPFKKGFDERRNIKGQPAKTIERMIEEGGYDMAEVIAMLHKKAAGGDVRAAEVLLSYTYSKPKQNIDMTTQGDKISSNVPTIIISRK